MDLNLQLKLLELQTLLLTLHLMIFHEYVFVFSTFPFYACIRLNLGFMLELGRVNGFVYFLSWMPCNEKKKLTNCNKKRTTLKLELNSLYISALPLNLRTRSERALWLRRVKFSHAIYFLFIKSSIHAQVVFVFHG